MSVCAYGVRKEKGKEFDVPNFFSHQHPICSVFRLKLDTQAAHSINIHALAACVSWQSALPRA